MDEIKAGNRVFKKGIPLICIPVCGITAEDIHNQAKAAFEALADVIEWRADWYEDVFHTQAVLNMLSALKAQCGDIPLLFTFRTKKEGGEKEMTAEQYEELLMAVIESGLSELVDIELFSGDDLVKKLIDAAKKKGIVTVVSSHDFHHTPDTEELVSRFMKMKQLGGDLPKLAVMPESKEDVFRLMAAASRFTSSNDSLCIAISMGKLGVISRAAGETFGSVMTFASAAKASAPGQMGASELRKLLIQIHESL